MIAYVILHRQEKKGAKTAMTNILNRDYNIFALFKYTIPSILSILFMSLYQMTDAIFVANFVGENALASLNIVYPVISIMLAITLMFSTGGSAVVAKKMGEGKNREAKEDFTLIVLAEVFLAVLISILCFLFFEPLLSFLGATPVLYQDCVGYLGPLLPFLPMAVLQFSFSSFFIAAGKPGIGFALTAISGISNIILDYVLITKFHMGISGSAWGTVIGYLLSAIPGFLYFSFQRKGLLYFVRPKLRLKMLGFSCFNGSSEMVSNLSVSVTTLMFNKLALSYMGEKGVTAITVILYAQFFLTAVFMGFIGGAGPLISFQLGCKNKKRLNALFRYSTYIVTAMTVVVVFLSYLLAKPIVAVYINSTSDIFPLALHGFVLFAISYLFAGFNIYASGLFTALHNGKVSAIISLMRTFVFLVLCLMILPRLIGADGIWLAVPVAEFLSCIISVYYMIKYRKEYYFSFSTKNFA